jgi:hypothetical protein
VSHLNLGEIEFVTLRSRFVLMIDQVAVSDDGDDSFPLEVSIPIFVCAWESGSGITHQHAREKPFNALIISIPNGQKLSYKQFAEFVYGSISCLC